MIYQLAKTSVGLSGQVKWDLILNASKVVDLQIVPIHESINFNYTKREDTLNYSHIENLQRLYRKIPSQFFSPVVNPKLTTGYPVRNNGVRVETHENSYEMGMKRNKSYKRYGKQFSFFCPIWCDSIEEMNKLVFRIVVANIKGDILCTKTIDHSLIRDYLNQYMLSTNLNSDLIYISFGKKLSWITGVNVESGVVQTKDTLGIIEDLTSQERPMMEVDNMLLCQFSKRKMISKQLFNFNFEFNIGDIVNPELIHDLSGEKINVYVDCYTKDTEGNLTKVPFRDMYSNYDSIPRYDITKGDYNGKLNCLDYLGDPSNIDLLGQNKLVQDTFHWSLRDNDKYIFNLYDGCCPVFDEGNTTYECRGMYFDTPDTSATEYDKMKNPLGWLKPVEFKPNREGIEIAEDLYNFLSDDQGKGVHFEKKNEKSEFFWINDIKFKGEFEKVNEEKEAVRLDDLKVYFLYFPQSLMERTELRNALKAFGGVDPFEREDIGGDLFWFYEHLINNTEEEIDNWIKKGKAMPGHHFYTIIPKSMDKLIFLYANNSNGAPRRFYEDSNWCEKFIVPSVITGFKKIIDGKNDDAEIADSLTRMTCRSYNSTSNSEDPSKKYAPFVYSSHPGDEFDKKMKAFMKNAIRTTVDNLKNIFSPEVVSFKKTVVAEQIDRPKQSSKWFGGDTERTFYKAEGFSYVLRYDGNIIPFFIDGTSEKFYNMVYITKQFNQQINVLDTSDQDMSSFNTYANTGFHPIYPSLDYFPLRKKRCKYNIYHRGSRRYYWEKSWFKKNEIFIFPESIQITYVGSELTEELLKLKLYNFLEKKIRWNVRGDKAKKRQLIFDNFVFPLYDYSYTFDYKDNKNIKTYVYKIKYTLK